MSKARTGDDMGWLFDLGGASALAGAAGFAFFNLGPAEYQPSGAAVAASLAFLAVYALLRRVGGEPSALPLSQFALDDIEFEPEPEALILDDILASMGPESRVVRLFEPDQMPTAGQLQARIDEHIGGASDADAADALHEALADIRRSLR
jgi:hypothetical protein